MLILYLSTFTRIRDEMGCFWGAHCKENPRSKVLLVETRIHSDFRRCIELYWSYRNCIFILIFYIFVESIKYCNNNNNNNLDNVNFQRKLIKSYNVLCERISFAGGLRNCRLKGWLNSFGRIINVKESTTRYHRFQRYIIHNRNRAIRNHLFPWTLFT